MKKFILICLLVAFCSTAFSYQTYIPSRFSSKDRLVYYEQQPLFAVRGASSISYLRKFLEVAIKNNWGVKSKRPLGKGKIVKFKSKKEIELNFTHDDKKTLGSRRKMPSLLIDVILANRFKVNGVV